MSKKGSSKGLCPFVVNSSPSPWKGEGDQGGEVFRQPLMENLDITVEPIGVVRNEVKEIVKNNWETIISQIIIKDNFKQALSGLDKFPHIVVIYWMHQVSSAQRLVQKVHPKGRQDLPLVGVFASRSPARPNPIGIKTVKLLECRDNILKVAGLDAIDGTPVLDIKPYLPGYDSPAEAKASD